MEVLPAGVYGKAQPRATIATTSYTLGPTDMGFLLIFTSNSPITLTCPPNGTTAIASGLYVDVLQKGTGQITFTEGAGVDILPPVDFDPVSRGQGSRCALQKYATDDWSLMGDLEAS